MLRSSNSDAANLPRKAGAMGTMRERSPGSWELTVSAGVDPTTGRYTRVIRTARVATKREAKAALRQLEVEVASGLVGFEDPSVAELLERWLAHLEDLGRSPSTLYGYRNCVNRDVIARDRCRPVVEADRRPPGRAVLVAASTRSGPGDHPPDARHRPGGVASGRAVGARVTQCCVVGVGAVATPAGAAAADGRARSWPSSRPRTTWTRCSGSTCGWWRRRGCAGVRHADCGGVTSILRPGS